MTASAANSASTKISGGGAVGVGSDEVRPDRSAVDRARGSEGAGGARGASDHFEVNPAGEKTTIPLR